MSNESLNDKIADLKRVRPGNLATKYLLDRHIPANSTSINAAPDQSLTPVMTSEGEPSSAFEEIFSIPCFDSDGQQLESKFDHFVYLRAKGKRGRSQVGKVKNRLSFYGNTDNPKVALSCEARLKANRGSLAEGMGQHLWLGKSGVDGYGNGKGGLLADYSLIPDSVELAAVVTDSDFYDNEKVRRAAIKECKLIAQALGRKVRTEIIVIPKGPEGRAQDLSDLDDQMVWHIIGQKIENIIGDGGEFAPPDPIDVIKQWTPAESIDELVNPPPLPEPMLENFLPFPTVTLLAGASGTGKTYIVVYLACCAATGKPFGGDQAGFKVCRTGTTVILAGEDEDVILKNVLAQVVRDAFPDPNDRELILQKVRIISLCGIDVPLAEKDGQNAVVSPLTNRIISTLSDIDDLLLVVFDTWSRFEGLSTDGDNNAASTVVRAMERVKTSLQCNVISPCHVSQTALMNRSDGMEAVSGALAKVNNTRGSYITRKIGGAGIDPDKEDEVCGSLFNTGWDDERPFEVLAITPQAVNQLRPEHATTQYFVRQGGALYRTFEIKMGEGLLPKKYIDTILTLQEILNIDPSRSKTKICEDARFRDRKLGAKTTVRSNIDYLIDEQFLSETDMGQGKGKVISILDKAKQAINPGRSESY